MIIGTIMIITCRIHIEIVYSKLINGPKFVKIDLKLADLSLGNGKLIYVLPPYHFLFWVICCLVGGCVQFD